MGGTLLTQREVADRACNKRLKAMLPSLIKSLRQHGRMLIGPDVRNKLPPISPALIDRVHKPVGQTTAWRRRRRRLASLLRNFYAAKLGRSTQ